MTRFLLPWSLLYFFNSTAPTEIYTLSLHDALPIYLLFVDGEDYGDFSKDSDDVLIGSRYFAAHQPPGRSEEHTSELQSHSDLVCRLLLEKKKPIATRRRRDRSITFERRARTTTRYC